MKKHFSRGGATAQRWFVEFEFFAAPLRRRVRRFT
jgi:hypothetical protein